MQQRHHIFTMRDYGDTKPAGCRMFQGVSGSSSISSRECRRTISMESPTYFGMKQVFLAAKMLRTKGKVLISSDMGK